MTDSEHPFGGQAYPSAVRDIQDIRFQNLAFLLEECAEDIGSTRGAAARLATLSGVKPSFISMLSRHAVHSDTGKRRQIGDDTATKLEQGMRKPPGWMDIDRSQAQDYKEAALLDKMRLLTPGQLDAIERLMDQLSAGPGPLHKPHDPSSPSVNQ